MLPQIGRVQQPEPTRGDPQDPGRTAAADDLARRCADALAAADAVVASLGIRLEDVGPGRSRVSMTVVPTMVNAVGLCHGGYVATLADTAFAFACNTYGEVTVAAGFDISFLAPAGAGDVLVADAVERHRRGRSGLYDVTVRRDGQVVAELRGRSRSLGRPMPGVGPASG